MADVEVPDADTVLAALHRSHDRLVHSLGPLSDDDVAGPSYASEWSIAQVASHLGSGAEIFGLMLDAGLAGTPAPGLEQFRPVWDRWEAKAAPDQARDAIEADAKFLHTVDDLPAADRQGWQLDLFGTQQTLAGLLRLRLGEHVLHSWDVAVALDPSATLPDDGVDLIVDMAPGIAARAGKPPGESVTVGIETSSPARQYLLEIDAESVRLEPAEPPADVPRLRLPAEALIRLVYGRLDPEHTPAAVHGDSVDLDLLRRAFPGV